LSNADVWVKVGDGPELAFAFATSCSSTNCPAPWIEEGGAVYTFTLYDCSAVNCEIDHTKAPEVRQSWSKLHGNPPTSVANRQAVDYVALHFENFAVETGHYVTSDVTGTAVVGQFEFFVV
jgi:hypothetical protein